MLVGGDLGRLIVLACSLVAVEPISRCADLSGQAKVWFNDDCEAAGSALSASCVFPSWL